MRFVPPYLIAFTLILIVWRLRIGAPSLPDLRRVWWPLLLALFAVSAALTVRGYQRIEEINDQLPERVTKSQELEWVWTSDTAAVRVAEWSDAGQLDKVREGVDADTYSFIAFYPLAVFALTMLAVRAFQPESRLYGWGVAIAWLALVAGVFDFAENCGIVLELRGGRWLELAPLTASLALVKWTLLALNVLVLAAALVAATLPRGSYAAPPPLSRK